MAWSIDRYLNIRQAYAPTIRSDGKALAFLTNVTGTPQVWRVPLDDACATVPWPDQLTFGTDRVSEIAYSPASDDGRLLYIEDAGGTENHQLYLLDADRGQVVALSEGYEDAMHLFGAWRDDGRQIVFAANRRDPAVFDLYVQEMDGMVPGPVVMAWQNDVRGYLRSVAISPDHRRVTLARTASSFSNTLLEIDLATGQARELVSCDEPVRFSSVAYTGDGLGLFLITDLGSDYLYVAKFDLATGVMDNLVDPAWDCGALAVSRSANRLAYTVNVDGADRVFVLDLGTWHTRSMPDFSGAAGVVSDGRLVFTPDGDGLACAFAITVHTSDVMLWDVDRDDVQPVTQSSHGGVPESSFVAPELIRFPTFDVDADGEPRQIPAWYYLPGGDHADPRAGIIIVHGGPEGQSRADFRFLIQYLLQHGYAVLVPNVRGSTGYGKAYSHLDDVRKRMDSVADLAHAARWLGSQPEIDADRLVVYGGSYGGFMVLSAITTYPELWAAAVDIVGISNLATFLENTSDYRRAHRAAEYGSLEHDRDFLESIAPINHLDAVTAPLIVIHGRNDPRVPVSEAEQLVAALEARGVPVRLLIFDDEGHGIVKLRNKQVAYPAIVEFLRSHVG